MENKHRVIGETQGEEFDIAFVVPAYREGTGIIDLLISIAVYWVVEGVKVGIFVVVNNSQNAPKEFIESNKETAWLLVDIIRKNQNISKYSDEEQSQISDILHLGINVYLIDAYTKKGAPVQSNVWYARDIWTKIAKSYLKNNHSLICSTDADCEVSPTFLENLVKHMRPSVENDIKIATWRKNFFVENCHVAEETNYRNNIIHDFSYYMNYIVSNTSASRLSKIDNGIIQTTWAYTIITKWLFEEIWWYKHIAWWEDVQIWAKAEKMWHDISYLDDVEILVRSRMSTRTVLWHGHWFQVSEFWQKNLYENDIYSLKYYEILQQLEWHLLIAHSQFTDNRIKWIEYIHKSFSELIPNLEHSDILDMSNLYFEFYNETQIDAKSDAVFPLLLSELRIILSQYLERKNIMLVGSELHDFMDNEYVNLWYVNQFPFLKTTWVEKNLFMEDEIGKDAYVFSILAKMKFYSRLVEFNMFFEKQNVVDLKDKEDGNTKLYSKFSSILKDIYRLDIFGDNWEMIDSFKSLPILIKYDSIFFHFMFLQDFIKTRIKLMYIDKLYSLYFLGFISNQEYQKQRLDFVETAKFNSQNIDIEGFLDLYSELVHEINATFWLNFPLLDLYLNSYDFKRELKTWDGLPI